jgi:starch phosphorylase
MANITTFTVVPRLPKRLERLRELSLNLYWCWDAEATDLFIRIDSKLWTEFEQNPVRLLGEVSQSRLEELAGDDGYLATFDRVLERLDGYMAKDSWQARDSACPKGFSAAYFSAEFGLHESVSIYSGGLGVLAGDHLKSASDLGLPLVAVGLLYREGYHRQYLNADGWQQERYPRNDFFNIGIQPERDKNGEQIVVDVPYPGRVVKARIWRCQVGRVPLYLMDTDFDGNDPDDREITARLYGGDNDMRVRQEIMLGMGGVIALHAMDVHPQVYHMNEGHSAFMALQRIKDLVQNEELSLDEAIEAVKSASVFTTHTPVPAGNDMFPSDLIEHYFKEYCESVPFPMSRLLGLGRQDPSDTHELFCMTVLALRLSTYANGVSKLHGQVSRGMWTRTWPGVPESEVPITSITNGIHTRFWISRDLAELFDRYIGPDWVSNPADPAVWERMDNIPDAEFWRTHERRRERLVHFSREGLVRQLKHRGASISQIEAAAEALDPEALTIGFARRFATYKRAYLLMMDPERLVRILKSSERPVQLIIAGKAHPADNHGKEVIRSIVNFVREHDLVNNMVFLEDYNINVARYMVQGVDCWLNTPRRPMEASGTSGMKASANGALNISVPDGWWCEAEPLGENGWNIGQGEVYNTHEEQDYIESQRLYELLENEIAPIYYDRGRDGLPREWVRRMKTAVKTIGPVFNTHRMVQEYADRFYVPCAARREVLRADGRKRSRELTKWKEKVRACWDHVKFVNVESGATHGLLHGTELKVTADLDLSKLSVDDVSVEIYFGEVDPYGHVVDGQAVPMTCEGAQKGSVYRFSGAIHCGKTGQQGFTVRAIPSNDDLSNKHDTALIAWA